jgi:hypothetical protein
MVITNGGDDDDDNNNNNNVTNYNRQIREIGKEHFY